MAMILSALLRRGQGPRVDLGVAPLQAPERDWRPKPLDEIEAAPLAPADGANSVWQGRPGVRKPLWAILGNDPPFGWQAREDSESMAARHAPLASDDSPADKPAPEALPGDVSNAVMNGWAAVAREQGEPGLYVTGHRISGAGPNHTAIEYIAEDGTRQWISAGPVGIAGRIASGVGMSSEHGKPTGERRSDDPRENVGVGLVTPPKGMSDAEYWDVIKTLDEVYRDNVDYDLFPEIQDGFNSNSYTGGLLDASGGAYTAPVEKYVGGRSPLPTGHFAPLHLQGTGFPDSLKRQPAPTFRRQP